MLPSVADLKRLDGIMREILKKKVQYAWVRRHIRIPTVRPAMTSDSERILELRLDAAAFGLPFRFPMSPPKLLLDAVLVLAAGFVVVVLMDVCIELVLVGVCVDSVFVVVVELDVVEDVVDSVSDIVVKNAAPSVEEVDDDAAVGVVEVVVDDVDGEIVLAVVEAILGQSAVTPFP